MKRVLICTNHFYPETFRCNDVAFELVRRGYDVTVLTAIPDYPGGKFFEGYGFFRKRKETVNGVKVIRAFIIPSGPLSFREVMEVLLGYFLITLAILYLHYW